MSGEEEHLREESTVLKRLYEARRSEEETEGEEQAALKEHVYI